MMVSHRPGGRLQSPLRSVSMRGGDVGVAVAWSRHAMRSRAMLVWTSRRSSLWQVERRFEACADLM
jgi:hypothetical protein